MKKSELKRLIKECIIESISDDIKPGINGVIKKGFGWLSNMGEFYGINQYSHISSINNLPVSPELKSKLKKLLDDGEERLNSIKNDCEEIDGEWHCYDMEEDHIRTELAILMYNNGWIRIGLTSDKLFEFEGLSSSLKNKMMYIKKFKNQLDPDFDVKITPIKI